MDRSDIVLLGKGPERPVNALSFNGGKTLHPASFLPFGSSMVIAYTVNNLDHVLMGNRIQDTAPIPS
jgi:hypothetical protein